MNDFQQVIIYPVKGGKLVIHQRNASFRVIFDGPEKVIEFPQSWVNKHMVRLSFISKAASRTLARCGLEVSLFTTYG